MGALSKKLGEKNNVVNTYRKGSKRELAARKQLEEQGYLVEKKNSSRWESNDFWETFDILAIKPDGSQIRLIQVKSSVTDFYTARTHVANWVKDNNISNIKCEVWLKENYQPWRKDILTGKPCSKHSLAMSDNGCPEAKHIDLVQCDKCLYWVKEKPAKD